MKFITLPDHHPLVRERNYRRSIHGLCCMLAFIPSVVCLFATFAYLGDTWTGASVAWVVWGIVVTWYASRCISRKLWVFGMLDLWEESIERRRGPAELEFEERMARLRDEGDQQARAA